MSLLLTLLATACGLVGAFSLYVTSPNQQLLARPLATRRGLSIGIAALILSQTLFMRIAGIATAVYMLLTLVMLVWSVAPLLFAWLRRKRASS